VAWVASSLEVADIFRAHGEAYRRQHSLAEVQRRAMWAIEHCRTAAYGGRLYQCDHCGAEHPIYNSCGNRHCPKCQRLNKAAWLEQRARDLLPVEYFHVVFTVPAGLRALGLQNRRLFYDLLFQAAKKTLLALGADPKYCGGQLGFFAVLHTWDQRLLFHPHLHCVVPGGGLSPRGDRWLSCRSGYFAPVAVLASLFAEKLLGFLELAQHRGQLQLRGSLAELQHPVRFEDHLAGLRSKRWVVYSKPPFAGPETVLEYLARYAHRVAISNQRLVAMDGDVVVFRVKDRRANVWRDCRVSAEEFIRRFLLHILPERFVRIRYYGLLAHRHRREKLEQCRALLAKPELELEVPKESWEQRLERLLGIDPLRCPKCEKGRLLLRSQMPRPTARPPPPRAAP